MAPVGTEPRDQEAEPSGDGTINLTGRERNETLETSQTCRQLCHPGDAGGLSPGLTRLGPGSSILLS